MRLGLSARDSSQHPARPDRSGLWRRLGFQAVLLAFVALLPLHPPANGPMVLLPLDGAASAQTLAWATRSGARPISRGPYRGAWIVSGARAELIAPAFRHFTLILAAGAAGCSLPSKDIDHEHADA